MFIGHFGLGMAGKRWAPLPSLGTLFLAAQFVDLIWPIFLLTGVETVAIAPGHTAVTPLHFTYYPWSHSLLMSLVWALLFGGIYYLFRGHWKASFVLGGLVLSHWILDFITHIPDLPLTPWTSTLVGLGLWQSVTWTILVEGSIFVMGVIWYAKVTHAQNKMGSIGFWSLIGFLILVYVMNLIGPPPETVTQLGWVGLSQWILIAWAYWIDRNRTSRHR
jgi:hypothetical protein